jgi:hypothetical protein
MSVYRKRFPGVSRHFLASAVVLVLTAGLYAQDKGEPVSVHVREVQRNDDEPTEKGTWFHVKAVVESKTIVYTLQCDEFLNMDVKDWTLRCYDLAAGKDYTGYRTQNSLNFWKPEDKGKKFRMSVFSIVSEKEK